MRRPGKTIDLLAAGLMSLALLSSFGESALAQEKTDPANYYVSAAGAGAFWALRINDVTIWREFSARDTNFTLPVNPYLQPGRNEVSITFVSVHGDPYEYNVATPDFYALTGIERLNLVTRARHRATLVNIDLDAENEVAFPEKTRFGLPMDNPAGPPRRVNGGGLDQAGLADGWGNAWTARRVTAMFEIADEVPIQPWARAPRLEDTPELRASLLAAYRELHSALSSGDRERIRALYEPAWAHIAATMHYASVDEFLQKTSGLDHLGPVDSNGLRLRPLDLVLGERDFVIEFMAEGRLARIVPDPVLWASEANPDDVESTNVAFFLGSDQRLHIGAVLY